LSRQLSILLLKIGRRLPHLRRGNHCDLDPGSLAQRGDPKVDVDRGEALGISDICGYDLDQPDDGAFCEQSPHLPALCLI
jgi:hypothetical protein